MDNNSTTKKIIFSMDDENIQKSEKNNDFRTTMLEKPKNKRVITTLENWTFKEHDYTYENQLSIIHNLRHNTDNTSSYRNVLQQLNKKINGYKTQDINKSLYVPEKFVTIEKVLGFLDESKLMCYYCKTPVLILYEIVRETHQWTLDRIDNNYGHNSDNVMIACLGCNLKRKTMYHERYAFTKSCINIKKLL